MAFPFRPICATLLSATLVGALAAAASGAAASEKPTASRSCFLSRDWQGWSAPGKGDFLYFRVHLNDIYRVDLTPGTHVRRTADRFLVVKQRGSSWICSPLDLDLSISDTNGFKEPLIARSLRKLTPQEVAAIPKKELPY